ncbi:MAG: glycogen/starch/alpha-glucan phosphorylase [Candidatus Omnitrophica bacterium]|jgi:starch phosphorylase|nr:glycogen/starch/alpha-glucan phosphorylase [Candidatus Omnitrophota bacterium]MDD5079469.1 glycogen/starch/alpha-glucan phosphorylase [Candidatus Omnitrophota bacterium]
MAAKKIEPKWVNVHKDMTKAGIERSFFSKREYSLGKDKYNATLNDNFTALAIAIRDRLIERWINTQQRYHTENVKRVYYLSMEFLIGRLLGNNMLNLGIIDQVKECMEALGFDIEDIRDCESDAGLGNGGLGRLAACFLDSMATLGIPAHGYGIRYEYGIFNQRIINGHQVEFPDEWLNRGNPWEFARPEYMVKIRFYGHTYMFTDSKGRLRAKWADTEDVLAMPYDIPVPGYKTDIVNTLRLWSARSTEEFDLKYFNDGDYEHAVYNKMLSENISKVLYPNDAVSQGRKLRLKQEYFFTAASIADIIRRFKTENKDLVHLPDKVCIQLNDTHPSLAIVELMRILLDEENMEWETAWDITVKTFAYTNHTVMPEALESWRVPMFEELLPRHMQLIYEINMRFLRDVAIKFPGDTDRLRRMSIIEEGDPKKIRMAYLSLIGSHSVNGVSSLHSTLLKEHLFKDFYEISPEKFNNKTNGVTQRRWLQKANPSLSSLISEVIGEKWTVDLCQLEKLLPFKMEQAFRNKWDEVKLENKHFLADYIHKTTGIAVNTESMFDVQVKRIHEYKRQLLFALFIISQYLKIKNDPNADIVPRTFILGGKAAPGYYMAKMIIKFISSVAEVINQDKTVNDRIKVVFLENYRVSLAEKIFPASDLSEQISTAGTEASGTGCMKFMMNGALTIGTLDGANIEIAEAVGEDNIFTFGLNVEEVGKLQARGYNPQEYIDRSPVLKEIIRLIQSNFFSHVNYGLFVPIVESLLYYDRYFLCADFDPYCQAQDKVSELYRNKRLWLEKSIFNVAKCGRFSSDRTIQEYARDIWNVPVNIPCEK